MTRGELRLNQVKDWGIAVGTSLDVKPIKPSITRAARGLRARSLGFDSQMSRQPPRREGVCCLRANLMAGVEI
jgi:hypothetical protein